MEQYGGRIVIREYDPSWPQLFEQERARLREALGPSVIAIEHVGSTAVPGLAAKPIVDILVGVRSLDAARETCIEPLETLGYRYLPEVEAWLPEEMLFRKGQPWTNHVHVTEPGSLRWDEFILIRDYLRQNPDVAGAYGDLKKAVALVFGDDVDGFREAKRPFLRQVMELARRQADQEGRLTADGP